LRAPKLPFSGRETAYDQAESVTGRVLRILGAFDGEHQVRGLSDLARATGLPLSTAHRLIGELAAWGALERDADSRYRIGLRLWEVAALAPRSTGLRDTAMPFLEDLYEAPLRNVQLAVRDGVEAVYLERISGRRAVHVVTRVGSRLPLHATGVGLVLLAHAPADVLYEVLAAPLRAYTPHTITTPHALRRTLADVRRVGYVVSDRQIEEISTSIAAPVRGAAGEVVAALSIVIPSTLDARQYLPAVVTAARGASRAIGASSVNR
jgi:DNA-binding IclR family transcriptional regulator